MIQQEQLPKGTCEVCGRAACMSVQLIEKQRPGDCFMIGYERLLKERQPDRLGPPGPPAASEEDKARAWRLCPDAKINGIGRHRDARYACSHCDAIAAELSRVRAEAETAAFNEGIEAALTKALRIISDQSTARKRAGQLDAMYAINVVWHEVSALFADEPARIVRQGPWVVLRNVTEAAEEMLADGRLPPMAEWHDAADNARRLLALSEPPAPFPEKQEDKK